jgi:hypothetical protein
MRRRARTPTSADKIWPCAAVPGSGSDMKRTLPLAAAATLAVLSFGCGRAATKDASAPTNTTVMSAAIDEAHDDLASAPAKALDGDDGRLGNRAPGDYVVYRFSGSFRKMPAQLTERVVAREGGLFVIDYTLVEGKNEQTLRVHLNAGVGAWTEVLEVETIVKGVAQPALAKDFDAMMSKTILSVDDNEATTAVEEVTMDLGGKSLVCEKTSYKVKVGKDAATMVVTQSKDFAWGDVAAEIVSTSGTVLYRAEVLEMGKDAAAPKSGLTLDTDGF